MNLTLTIDGHADELRDVIEFLSRRQQPSDRDPDSLRRFVWDCTGDMLALLGVIATHSAASESVNRQQLVEYARLADEGRLNGVAGSVGRAWARHFGAGNPFTGKDLVGEVVYQIDQTLAVELVRLVAERTAGLAVSSTTRGRSRGDAAELPGPATAPAEQA